MKKMLWFPCTLLLSVGGGCGEKAAVGPTQTCADEHTLEVYRDREAIVTPTSGDTFCLVLDSAANPQKSLPQTAYLVPTPAESLPAKYRVAGIHVRLTGRKKSCYGLTTMPDMRTSFGYKLEIDAINDISK